jgi:2-oxo-4-hydroxy-4-carboxy-5-ureidoimidazoline decarboxylase
VTTPEFVALYGPDARAALERCCGARRWVDAVLAARPFADRAALFAASEGAFGALVPADWLEAFSNHPKIGDVDALRSKFATTSAWAGEEQRGASAADEATLQRLAEGNRAYEERFGYIFIVCATGKSASEMLALLEARMGNAPELELAVAASEQKKITRLRIEKLLASPG